MATATIPSAVQWYFVPSSTARTARVPVYYKVVEDPSSRQRFRCQCRAAQVGRRCWHTEAVIAGMVRPARPARPKQQATAPAVTASELYA